MKEIEQKIQKLFWDVPDSARKGEVIQEIAQNLGEKVECMIVQGQTRDAALQKAIDDFGDVDDLKRELVGSADYERSKRIGLSLAFSVWGAILITALVLFINFYYTPHEIWFVYPVFAVAWWPMSLFFHWLRVKRAIPVGLLYSVCSFVLIIGLMLFINFYYTPKIIWFVYPAFGVIWWPLAMLFYSLRQKSRKDDELDG
jgi:hypothetical protein